MSFKFSNGPGLKVIELNPNEMVNIKGVIFKVVQLSRKPAHIGLSPANSGQAKGYFEQTQPENLSKPKLAEPPKKDPLESKTKVENGTNEKIDRPDLEQPEPDKKPDTPAPENPETPAPAPEGT